MTSPDALERALAEALSPDAAPRPGDADMLSRLIDGAMKAPPPPIPKAPFVAGGAGAAVVAIVLAILPHATTVDAPAPIAEPAIAIEVHASAPVVLETPSVSAPVVETKEEEIGAADLFKRANEERRADKASSAIADYRTLQERFPSSPEARASLVALGRLLLDRRADYSGALAQFDRYLDRKGALEEEALIGRALALQHLGRRSEEDRAWHAVLDRYPDSIYAGEARSRIASLAR